MGKRAERKLTRQVKKDKKEAAISSVIHTGLDGGETFRNIANQVGMDFHIGKDQALKRVMKEYSAYVFGKHPNCRCVTDPTYKHSEATAEL